VDSQAALQANKATFFFQLVSSLWCYVFVMNIPKWLLNEEQERELDKVNAFYLQKEAEVCITSRT
jgi:CDK inhibitor PHO81